MKCLYSKDKKRRIYNLSGYTLIEVMMVIAIISIISGVIYVSYSNFRHNLVVSTLKSDLNAVASAMENERNFGNNGYPVDVTSLVISNFDPVTGPPAVLYDGTVTIAGGSTDSGETYCVDAVSSEDTSTYYYIDTLIAEQGAQPGSCTSSRPVPQNLAAAMVTNTSINITWDAVSGVDSYTLQQDIDPDFTSPTIFTLTTNTKLSTGLTTGINYYYRVNATVASATGEWSEVAYANTAIAPPTAPSVDVTYSAPNILATASSVTCLTGSAQYSFNSRINDGSWVGYGTWSSSTSTSQSAIEGKKYGYEVQARCYVDADTYSSPVASAEDTYIHPFTTIPAAPTVSASTPDWQTTNFSWNTTSCPGGAPAHYQYDFTTSYGYDSGWQSTDSTSAGFTTASAGYTYTLQVKTQCYTAYSSSSWSSNGSANYVRPYAVTFLIIAGGAGGGAGDSYGNGGGGGAGGYIYSAANLAVQGYGVTVGGGGAGGHGDPGHGVNGGNSSFAGLTAIGGGGGGGGGDGTDGNGRAGGSGGGASGSSSTNHSGGGYTSGQGHVGGNSCTASSRASGGGGGATGGNTYFNGGCSIGTRSGDGGTGYTTSISGASVCYVGGGGGGIGSGTEGYGTCGGGNAHETQSGEAAVANRGSGGGGGYNYGGNGGSGIVIIRYATGAFSASGGNSAYTVGTDTVRVFTGSGTFTIN